MGLLRKQKILFCHVAKNGGCTVHKIMEELDILEFCFKMRRNKYYFLLKYILLVDI